MTIEVTKCDECGKEKTEENSELWSQIGVKYGVKDVHGTRPVCAIIVAQQDDWGDGYTTEDLCSEDHLQKRVMALVRRMK